MSHRSDEHATACPRSDPAPRAAGDAADSSAVGFLRGPTEHRTNFHLVEEAIGAHVLPVHSGIYFNDCYQATNLLLLFFVLFYFLALQLASFTYAAV